MAAKYVLKKTTSGEFMFNLQAANGETILTSERYTAKSGAEHGIASVRTNAPHDARYERRTSSAREPYFVLKAVNGEVIGTSEMYSSASACGTGIESVKRNGPVATVDDQT
jgi:hypothetical protein